MEFWGQVISIVAMAVIILSFQCKNNKKLVFVKGIGAFLFAVSFFMVDQPTAAAFNVIAVIWSFMNNNARLKNKICFGTFCVVYLIITLITFEKTWSFVSVWAFILMLVQIADLYSAWYCSGKLIRNIRFFIISPAWLINNTLIGLNIGGAICEVFIMVSVIVSFVRYRKNGFEE